MSELRRRRQAQRALPDFQTKLIITLGKYWKQFLAVIGVPTGLDIFREIARAKAGDWILERLGTLGSIGSWVATYPFALVTVGLAVAIVSLVVVASRNSDAHSESTILDSEGNPYHVPRVSKALTRGLAIVAVICVAFIGYGVYIYYRTTPLLEKYPLGYVVFTDDYLTGAVTPLEARRGFETYGFDFRPVRITQNTTDRIAIRLPDMLKDKKVMATGVETGGWKRVGYLGGGAIGDDKGMIVELAEILAIKESEITFLVGFQRQGPLPTSHPVPSK